MPSAARFYADVASAANLTQKDVKRVFDEATRLIVKEMKLNGAFKVPGLVVLKTIKKKHVREASGNVSAKNAK